MQSIEDVGYWLCVHVVVRSLPEMVTDTVCSWVPYGLVTLQVNCCPCRSLIAESNTRSNPAPALDWSNVPWPSSHSVVITSRSLVQERVAEFPNTRGCSWPVICKPSIERKNGRKCKKCHHGGMGSNTSMCPQFWWLILWLHIHCLC